MKLSAPQQRVLGLMRDGWRLTVRLNSPWMKWNMWDIQIQKGDSTELKELTGWKATIDIKTTLKDLLDYWIRKIGDSK